VGSSSTHFCFCLDWWIESYFELLYVQLALLESHGIPDIINTVPFGQHADPRDPWDPRDRWSQGSRSQTPTPSRDPRNQTQDRWLRSQTPTPRDPRNQTPNLPAKPRDRRNRIPGSLFWYFTILRRNLEYKYRNYDNQNSKHNIEACGTISSSNSIVKIDSIFLMALLY